MTSCGTFQEQMMAFAKGELQGLTQTKQQAHLEHCLACHEIAQKVQTALRAQAQWQPHLSDDHALRLRGRLEPYFVAPQKVGAVVRWAVAGGFLLAAFLWVWSMRAPSVALQKNPPVMAEKINTHREDLVPLAIPETQKLEWSPFIRALGINFAGFAHTEGPLTTVDMHQGVLAVSFDGGGTRRLQIRTAVGRVDVVGTRFAVEISDDAQQMRVTVMEGRVRVQAQDQGVFVDTGEERIFGVARASTHFAGSAQVRGILQETYLDKPQSNRRVELIKNPPVVAPPQQVLDRRSGEEVTELFERAEKFVSEKNYELALQTYQEVAEKALDQPVLCDMARYEGARILGFHLQKKTEARRLLTELANKGVEEVGRQAQLALCELAKPDACRTQECLQALLDHSTGAIVVDAEQLKLRWQKELGECRP